MLKNLPIAALVVAIAALTAPGAANAVPYRVNATGVCQGALPVYDVEIRKRPLAVKNEGTSGAYISCSIGADDGIVHTEAQIYLHNTTGADVDVSCTIVTGNNVLGATYYTPAPITVPAGGNNLLVQTFNNAVDTANLVNASCLLPPGVDFEYFRLNTP